jgi:nicotinamidase-related amidase
MKALIVIDVQQGLFERATKIHRAGQMLENINCLVEAARAAGAPVIYIQHDNEKGLVKGSYEWQLHPAIQPLEREAVIQKRHGNAFEETPLHEMLQTLGVREVVLTGLVTNGCVKSTAQGALALGYSVTLVTDGHSNFSTDAANLIDKWNHSLGEQGARLEKTMEVQFGSS